MKIHKSGALGQEEYDFPEIYSFIQGGMKEGEDPRETLWGKDTEKWQENTHQVQASRSFAPLCFPQTVTFRRWEMQQAEGKAY